MNLTNEEIRVKIAEACGYKDLETRWEKYHQWECPDGRIRFGTISNKYACLPDYLNDLNACAEFEKVNWDNHKSYLRNLIDVCQTPEDAITATPLQRCLAYLKTKGIIQ